MQQQDVWDHDAAQRYDTPGEGMFAPDVLGPTVQRLVELAGGGAALEFGIGTGRVAIPLAARGVRVAGIELSRPMIQQLRTRAARSVNRSNMPATVPNSPKTCHARPMIHAR